MNSSFLIQKSVIKAHFQFTLLFPYEDDRVTEGVGAWIYPAQVDVFA